MEQTIAAIVPMRHYSERVPGKNYRIFGDRPLFHHIINSLLTCPSINIVVIDTDSPLIIKEAEEHFPQVIIIERPDNLRAGDIPMNDVLMNTVSQINADFYLQTHSTNPLIETKTLTDGIKKFLTNFPIFDSLFSVSRVKTRLWDGLGRAINHNPAILLRTQDLPPIYEENSCFYIFTKEILELKHNRIGNRPLLFEIDPVEAWDIDNELDFKIAEFLFRERESRI